MKNRIKLAGAATVGALALSMTGLAGTAKADTAEDLQIMLENVPAAAEVLTERLQIAIDNLAATNSVEQAAEDIIFALAATGGVLGTGTEQFGLLGLGIALSGATFLNSIAPYLQAIDDPSLVEGLIDTNDLSIMLGNLAKAVADSQPIFASALISLLEGNLTAGTGFSAGTGRPAFVGDAIAGANEFLLELFAGTNFVALRPGLLTFPALLATATASQAQQVEDALEPLFAALGPVTEPIIVALEGL